MAARVISSVLGVIVVLVVLAWGALYVSLDAVHSWPSRVVVQGLSAPATVIWTDRRMPRVRAESLEDRISALGYVHGLTRTWTVVLLRQTAQGKLGEWLGASADSIDSWARQLGWAGRAQQAFADLPEQQKAWFRAYARGMNAGLETRSHRTPELLLLEIGVEPWEPWHALAIEQLVAWLGTTDISRQVAAVDSSQLDSWAAADRELHAWLRFHDLEQSAAWTVEDASGRSLVQRQVYGSSALPLVHAVSFDSGNGPRHVATVPGTLILPAGTNASYSWSVFPTSAARVDSASVTGADQPVRRDTIRRRDGSTYETEVRQSSAGLFLSDRVRLDWTGFDTATDIDAWTSLWQGENPGETFDLFEGAGLLVYRDGGYEVLGEPAVVRRFSGGAAVGQDPWLNHLVPAIRGDRRGRASNDLAGWEDAEEMYSPWADTLQGHLVAGLGSSQVWRSEAREAMAYVRNWEATFEGSSIGATIFDTWLTAYRDSTGRLPSVEDELTAHERIRLYRTFNRTVDQLIARFGQDFSRWRWERIQPTRQYFPLWAVPDILPSNLAEMAGNRYAPIQPSGGGHPTTLWWGPSPLQTGTFAASVAWEASLSTGEWQRMYIRKSEVPVEKFLGRYLDAHEYPRVFVLDSTGTTERRVTLQPASKDT